MPQCQPPGCFYCIHCALVNVLIVIIPKLLHALCVLFMPEQTRALHAALCLLDPCCVSSPPRAWAVRVDTLCSVVQVSQLQNHCWVDPGPLGGRGCPVPCRMPTNTPASYHHVPAGPLPTGPLQPMAFGIEFPSGMLAWVFLNMCAKQPWEVAFRNQIWKVEKAKHLE